MYTAEVDDNGVEFMESIKISKLRMGHYCKGSQRP